MKKSDEKILVYAKQLRENQTDFENKLWYYLRAKRFMGLKFKRQVPIGEYIVDFLCTDNNVIIELDGSQHLDNIVYDTKRDNYLKSKGYRILRILDSEMNNMDGVLEYIKNFMGLDVNPSL
jgi:very-short-patch-repair endonuclease